MPPIHSSLQDLQRKYVSGLPERVSKLRSLYRRVRLTDSRPEDLQVVYRQVHSLTGSAGTYGLQSFAEASLRVESKLKAVLDEEIVSDHEVWEEIDTELIEIERLAQSCFVGNAPGSSPNHNRQLIKRAPSIYLVEHDTQHADSLVSALHASGYQPKLFTSLADFERACMQEPLPEVVVLDAELFGDDSAVVHAFDQLKSQIDRLPPTVFISERDNLDSRLAAYRAGARRYLLKPVLPRVLIELLDALTNRMPPEPYRVLLVDDDEAMLEAESSVLRAAGLTVKALSEPLSTLNAINDFRPEVVVLDVHMPEVSGPELAAIIREQESYLSLPIIFLSGETDMQHQLHALNLGGDDFLIKPVEAEYLISAVTARARRARENNVIQDRLRTELYEREREHLTLDHHALVSVTDTKGDIIEVNDRFCRVSGYSREELLGRNHRVVKSGEHPPTLYKDIWWTITQGHVWQGEICNRRKDGSLYWVSTTITPFLDGSGRPYQYVSIRTEITELKVREEAQRRENAVRAIIGEVAGELFSANAESLDDVVEAVLGLAGEHLKVDHAYLFLLSNDGSRMTNTHEWLASGSHTRQPRLQDLTPNSFPWLWQQILKEQSILVGDVRSLPKAASLEKVMFESQDIRAFSCFPIRKGSEILGFLGFDQRKSVRDWRKAATDLFGLMAGLIGNALERTKSERLAQAARERLRRGQMFANIGTWEWNIKSGDLFWTERIAPLFGYAEGDLETSYENFLAAIHPDDRRLVVDAVDACLTHDTPYNIEHRVVWPDGTVRWLAERGAVLRDAQGEALTMLGVVQDIDDRKKAELELSERQKQLEEAQSLASLGNWSADIESGRLTRISHAV